MTVITLDSAFKKTLKQKGHHLKPVVQTGQKGLTDAVMSEIDLALKAHELIKVRLCGSEPADRKAWQQQIESELQCAVVQSIGFVLLLYRPSEDA